LRSEQSATGAARGTSDSSNQGHASELQKLQFDKEALEKKLRKYASHCQELYEEKEKLIDTISHSFEQKIDDENLASTIISICDKHASLQEECEVLSSQLKSHQKSIARVKELECVVSTLRQETEDLRQKVSQTKSDADGGSNKKVMLLEQENLNLCLDIQKLKQQLQVRRALLLYVSLQCGRFCFCTQLTSAFCSMF